MVSIGGGIDSGLGYKLVTNVPAYDSDGNIFIIGNEYEMYLPTAVVAHHAVGIIFDNPDCKFIYKGIIEYKEYQYIAGTGVAYDPDIIGEEMYQGSVTVQEKLGCAIICPLGVARRAIRKATS